MQASEDGCVHQLITGENKSAPVGRKRKASAMGAACDASEARVKRARGEEGRRRGGGGGGHVMWGEEGKRGGACAWTDLLLRTYHTTGTSYQLGIPTYLVPTIDFLGMKVCALKTLLLI